MPSHEPLRRLRRKIINVDQARWSFGILVCFLEAVRGWSSSWAFAHQIRRIDENPQDRVTGLLVLSASHHKSCHPPAGARRFRDLAAARAIAAAFLRCADAAGAIRQADLMIVEVGGAAAAIRGRGGATVRLATGSGKHLRLQSVHDSTVSPPWQGRRFAACCVELM